MGYNVFEKLPREVLAKEIDKRIDNVNQSRQEEGQRESLAAYERMQIDNNHGSLDAVSKDALFGVRVQQATPTENHNDRYTRLRELALKIEALKEQMYQTATTEKRNELVEEIRRLEKQLY